MNINFYQADCGDAARIKYIGTDGQKHNVFVDSGFAKTFRHILKSEIESISKAGESIDLWIVSHIHDDHVGGVVAYINAIRTKELKDVVEKWIYNFPRASPEIFANSIKSDISQAKSIRQSDDLSDYIISSKKEGEDITYDCTPINLRGLSITILSPDANTLAVLRNKYSVASKPLERIELDAISEAKARILNDYNIRIENFDLNDQIQDTSIENASSISMLIEFGGIRTLWLADAHPNVVASSLKKMGYSPENPLYCDLVKVSHHGSDGNNSNELYDIIRCGNFFFSANGENKYCLPSKKCIIRILKNKYRHQNDHYNIYFSYSNETLKSIFRVDTKETIEELNFTIHYQSEPVAQFTF